MFNCLKKVKEQTNRESILGKKSQGKGNSESKELETVVLLACPWNTEKVRMQKQVRSERMRGQLMLILVGHHKNVSFS